MVRAIQKTKVIPQLHYIDKVVDVTVCRYIGKVVDVPRVAGRAGSTGAGRGRTIEIADRWKIVEIPEIHTVQGVQTCEKLSTALVRYLAQAETVEDVEIGERSSTGGHRVVHGWPQGRPRMATGPSTEGHRAVHGWPQGRPRMATGPSSDGHRVVHGWPQGRLRMATGSSPDGQRVVSGWPKGRLRMAKGSSPDGHRVVSGWPQSRLRMARGRLRTARGSPFKPSTDGRSSETGRRRCTNVHQNGSEGRLLQVVYGWPTGRLRMAVHEPTVRPREQRRVPMDETVRESLEVAQLPFIDKVVDILVGAWDRSLPANLRLPCSSRLSSWTLFWLLLSMSNPLSLWSTWHRLVPSCAD